MINNTEFAERLRLIMDYYQLSGSSFADRIQVQRSSISHLLSGRNKPSLDFVMRVVKEFKEVELYWLLNGKGDFPLNAPPAPSQILPSETESPIRGPGEDQAKKERDVLEQIEAKSIERIVVFYDNGTFKTYRPGD